MLDVGFSFPLHRDGVRMRAMAQIAPGDVARVTTPYEAAALAGESPGSPGRLLLQRLVELGKRCGIAVGVFGAFALELVTGYPYTTETSDLDVLLLPVSDAPQLPRFREQALEWEQAFGTPLDMEAVCAGGFGVKVKELLSDQRTMMGKGAYEVELLPRDLRLFRPDGESGGIRFGG